MKVLETHLKAMENFEKERTMHRVRRDKLATKLSLTSELKTIEEMLQMKRSEINNFQSSSDPEEKKNVERQLEKLRKKRDRLIESVCDNDTSDDSDDSDNSDSEVEEGV